MELPDKLYFRIGEVAEIVGVEAHVLRYWEQEFRLRPHRSQAGQRLYRKQDVARFLRVRQLLHDEGFTIAGARKALAEGQPEARPPAGVDRELLGDLLRRVHGIRGALAALSHDLGEDDAP